MIIMEKMMDAIVKPIAGPGLELRRVPVPVPGPGEVLIKIHKTAICGTDVHIYNWDPWARQHIKPPMTSVMSTLVRSLNLERESRALK